jgi:hypothetical protein
MGASGDRTGRVWRGPCLGGCYDGVVMTFNTPIVVIHTESDDVACKALGEYEYKFGVWVWKEYR